MAIRVPAIVQAKKIILQSMHRIKRATAADVPRGHFSVYVGEAQTRFVVPISYLRHPSFQSLLCRAAEEFGFDHRMGAIRVPCEEDAFVSLTSQLNGLAL